MLYKVEAKCDECGYLHPLDVTIELEDGPSERTNLLDAFSYRGRQIPQELTYLVNLPQKPCPMLGVYTAQRSHFRIYITPA